MVNPVTSLSQSAQRVGIRTAAGATLLIATRIITRCIDLGALVVLGRLLSPADFGLVAIAMSVVMIVEAVMELPIGMALVTLPARTKSHYDTAFTIQLTKGVALASILVILAWPLAQFYHDPRLVALICALGIAPASRGLGSPRFVEFAIKLDYWPTFLMEVIGKLVALLLSAGLAWSTGSYWSLAIGTIATPVTMLGVSYIYAPHQPAFTIEKWRDFSAYFRWTTASQAMAALNWQIDQLILGRFVSRRELGRFSMGSTLSAFPNQILVGQVTNPLVVAFTLVRDDLSRLKGAFLKSAQIIAAIGLPTLVGISMNAEPIIRLVLGEQWLEAAPILRWLCVSVIPPLFVGPLIPLAITLNRLGIFFRLTLIECVVKVPLMLIATVHYGIAGAIVVRLVTSVVLMVSAMLAVRELIGLPLREQLFAQWRALVSVVIMGLVIVPLIEAFANISGFGGLVIDLTIVVSIGVAVYTSSTFLLWRLAGSPEGIELDLINLLASRLRKRRQVAPD